MKILIVMLLNSLLLPAFAGLLERSEKEHLRVNNRVSVGCEYLNDSPKFKANKIHEKLIQGSHVEVDFKANNTDFKIVIDNQNRAYLKGNNQTITARLKNKKYRGYKIKMLDFNSSDLQLAQDIDIKNLKCWVEMAVEKYHPITNEEVHINVHPYFNYDYRGQTTAIVENALSDESKQQLILLDDTYQKASLADPAKFIISGGSYLRNRSLNIFDLKNIDNAAVLVSPSGHNEFIINQPLLNVLYTGGNHNYCMLSNTAHLIEAFLKGQDTEQLELVYDTNAIVVQKKTFAQGLSIPRNIIKRSNVLAQMFQDRAFAAKYHRNYFEYFAHNRILWFTNFFRTVRFEYKSAHFSQTLEIPGNGDKDFVIKMTYK